jgi:nucleolar GTP-binding protein
MYRITMWKVATRHNIIGIAATRYVCHSSATTGSRPLQELRVDSSGVNESRPLLTGSFQLLPMVAPAVEVIDSAVRRAHRVPANTKLKNEAARARNRVARQMDVLMKELTQRLGEYERGFPPVERLHPFEAALLELTVGAATYRKTLSRVGALRKAVVEVSKGYARAAAKVAKKKDALVLQDEGFQKVQAVYERGSAAVEELKQVAKALRQLPVVDPIIPTMALVGAPNVGKSSLVQLLSSGLPEIQNYPFTTRSIKMGHFYVGVQRYQVTDTPGLLNRRDEDRNAMELLTLASLQHLPTAVMFVIDLTAECGTSVQNQLEIRKDVKERFPDKPWIDVFSKADQLATACADIHFENGSIERYMATVPNALSVSSLTGDGIEELKEAMLTALDRSQ